MCCECVVCPLRVCKYVFTNLCIDSDADPPMCKEEVIVATIVYLFSPFYLRSLKSFSVVQHHMFPFKRCEIQYDQQNL